MDVLIERESAEEGQRRWCGGVLQESKQSHGLLWLRLKRRFLSPRNSSCMHRTDGICHLQTYAATHECNSKPDWNHFQRDRRLGSKSWFHRKYLSRSDLPIGGWVPAAEVPRSAAGRTGRIVLSSVLKSASERKGVKRQNACSQRFIMRLRNCNQRVSRAFRYLPSFRFVHALAARSRHARQHILPAR